MAFTLYCLYLVNMLDHCFLTKNTLKSSKLATIKIFLQKTTRECIKFFRIKAITKPTHFQGTTLLGLLVNQASWAIRASTSLRFCSIVPVIRKTQQIVSANKINHYIFNKIT